MAENKSVKKQAVKEPSAEGLPDPRKPRAWPLVRNIHNTGIWTGTCKLAPGHAVDCDPDIADKLLEQGFIEVMDA